MNLDCYLIPSRSGLDEYMDAIESYLSELEGEIAFESAMEATSEESDDTSRIDTLVSSIKSNSSKLRAAAKSGNEEDLKEAKTELSKAVTDLETEGKKKMSEGRKRKLKIATAALAAAIALIVAIQGGRKIDILNKGER